jgi:hypothetical protein
MNIPVTKLVVCRSLVLALITAFVSFPAHAAPSLSITKPPVVSGPNPNTGPAPTDPQAKQGQWFLFQPPGTTVVAIENRAYQFHDNASGAGGGAASTKAIYGYVSHIIAAAGPISGIVAFDITATITNDDSSATGTGLPGHNSHGESLVAGSTPVPYRGPLVSPVLVADFALASPTLFPPGPVANTPYAVSPGPRIVAVDNSMKAWYCFNNTVPAGGYYVPGWEFPTINPGASATQVLHFEVLDGGLTASDARNAAIMQSYVSHSDILSSRTISLKVSHWVGGLQPDTGASYSSAAESSDVEVFHDIIPVP